MNRRAVLRFCLAALLVPILSVGLTVERASATDTPKVFYAADTVAPGERALIYGGVFAPPSGSATVKIGRISDAETGSAPNESGWQTVQLMNSWQSNPFSSAAKESVCFIMPESFEMGIYGYRVLVGDTASEVYYLNRPNPWWMQGDKGTKATVGGRIQIMGKCLAYEGQQPAIYLCPKSGGGEIVLSPMADKEFVLEADLPASVAAGDYAVWVHNGYGGSLGRVSVGDLTVEASAATAQTVYDVRTYGADPTGAQDSTVAIQKALNAAGKTKGAVYLPTGSYQVTKTLYVQPDTTLYGDGMNVSSLFVPVGTELRNYVLDGSNAAYPMNGVTLHDFGIYTQARHGNVLRGGDRFTMDHILIRAVAYYGHNNVGEPAEGFAGMTVTDDTQGWGSGVLLKDAKLFSITNCDIRATGYALNLFVGQDGVIENNKLHGGTSPMQSYGLARVLFTNNEFKTVGLYGSGNVLSLFYSAASYNVLMRENVFCNIYGGDREAITLDGHGTAYYGGVSETNGTQMTLASAPYWGTTHKDMIDSWDLGLTRRDSAREWHGVTVYIVSGTGVGQYRNLVGCDGNAITIENEWDVEPDATSVLSIGKFNGRHIFLSNRFYDSGTGVQLYPPNVECIVAYNYMERAGDTGVSGQFRPNITNGNPRVEPGWFSMFLYNTVAEGNGFAAQRTSLRVFGDGDATDKIRISRGHVVKGNRLLNNALIALSGAMIDTVVEKNYIINTDGGTTGRMGINTSAINGSNPGRLVIPVQATTDFNTSN